MVFGTEVIHSGCDGIPLNPELMSIIGEQDGLIATFVVTLLFRRSHQDLAKHPLRHPKPL
jgi:hypothetical protein